MRHHPVMIETLLEDYESVRDDYHTARDYPGGRLMPGFNDLERRYIKLMSLKEEQEGKVYKVQTPTVLDRT